jgi:WD40 repeat protein
VHVLEGHTAPVRSVAIDPEGTWLASGGDDRVVRRWDLGTGRPMDTLRGHVGPVRGVAVSPDGTLVATAGVDGTLRLWTATGAPLAALVSLPEGWACLLPDGGYKLVGAAAGAFWHVAGLCRFEPGELDRYLPSPRRLAADARIR